MRDQILIIGLVVALGVGYLIGALSHSETHIVTAAGKEPNNYDPARAMANDMLNAQKSQTETCWRQVLALVERQQKTPDPQAGH